MKIGVIGATGKEGSLIVKELLKRGYDVTAIVRDKTKITSMDISVIEKDVFSITTDDLKNFDVLVNAFGTPYGQNLEFQYQTSLLSLTNALLPLPGIRLIVVGGAGSLFTDETEQYRVIESIPVEWKAVPENAFEAFKRLKESTINWTYFSPASFFDPDGPKTGKYRLGTDYVILNAQGESYISYEDYAIALVDEIENKHFIKRRFTAVSNNKNESVSEEKSSDSVPKSTRVETNKISSLFGWMRVNHKKKNK